MIHEKTKLEYGLAQLANWNYQSMCCYDMNGIILKNIISMKKQQDSISTAFYRNILNGRLRIDGFVVLQKFNDYALLPSRFDETMVLFDNLLLTNYIIC